MSVNMNLCSHPLCPCNPDRIPLDALLQTDRYFGEHEHHDRGTAVSIGDKYYEFCRGSCFTDWAVHRGWMARREAATEFLRQKASDKDAWAKISDPSFGTVNPLLTGVCVCGRPTPYKFIDQFTCVRCLFAGANLDELVLARLEERSDEYIPKESWYRAEILRYLVEE